MLGILLPPLARYFVQLRQHLVYVFHSVGDAVGYCRRNGWLIVPVNESAIFEQTKPVTEHAGRNACDLASQLAEAGRTVAAEHPEDVQGPRPGQYGKKLADRAGALRRMGATHVTFSSFGYFDVTASFLSLIIFSN